MCYSELAARVALRRRGRWLGLLNSLLYAQCRRSKTAGVRAQTKFRVATCLRSMRQKPAKWSLRNATDPCWALWETLFGRARFKRLCKPLSNHRHEYLSGRIQCRPSGGRPSCWVKA